MVLRCFSTPPAKIEALLYEIEHTSEEKGTALPEDRTKYFGLFVERLEQEGKSGKMGLHRFTEVVMEVVTEVVTGVRDIGGLTAREREPELVTEWLSEQQEFMKAWASAVWVR